MTEDTLKRIRQDWQAEILKEFRDAVIAELSGEERDAMLRQVTDIAQSHGLVIR